MQKDDCIFCKIASGKIPSAKVYEDKGVISFLDIAPANKSHCLVLPKQHYVTLMDIPDAELQRLFVISKKVVRAISSSCGNQSFNILMNNGKDAGQVVEHAHIHLIPRFSRDGLRFNWRPKKYKGDEISEIKDKIKKFL